MPAPEVRAGEVVYVQGSRNDYNDHAGRAHKARVVNPDGLRYNYGRRHRFITVNYWNYKTETWDDRESEVSKRQGEYILTGEYNVWKEQKERETQRYRDSRHQAELAAARVYLDLVEELLPDERCPDMTAQERAAIAIDLRERYTIYPSTNARVSDPISQKKLIEELTAGVLTN